MCLVFTDYSSHSVIFLKKIEIKMYCDGSKVIVYSDTNHSFQADKGPDRWQRKMLCLTLAVLLEMKKLLVVCQLDAIPPPTPSGPL